MNNTRKIMRKSMRKIMKSITIYIIMIMCLGSGVALYAQPEESQTMARVPGDINRLSSYTDFLYNYPSDQFLYHLNDRMLFLDRPDGMVASSGVRNGLLNILRWHNIIKRSLKRAGMSDRDMITLNVGEEEGFRKTSIILTLIGLKLEKSPEGKFIVTPGSGQGVIDYYRFAAVDPATLQIQLNKTRRFHFQLKESTVPVPWDIDFLNKITEEGLTGGNFFANLVKNEQLSLLLAVLNRLSHREVRYIDGLVKGDKAGAWQQVYKNPKFLMGMFYLADALRVTSDGYWLLPGGEEAVEFWNTVSGEDHRKTPFRFLYQLATKDEGKLNYLFLFARFLSSDTQRYLFTGDNAAKMVELYKRVSLSEDEKLNPNQFTGLRDFNFYTLFYPLTVRDKRVFFPLGVDTWLKAFYPTTKMAAAFDLNLDLDPQADADKELVGLDETRIVLKSGETILGRVRKLEEGRLVVAKNIEIDQKNIQSIDPPLEAIKKEEPPEPEVKEEKKPEPAQVEDVIPEEEEVETVEQMFRKKTFWGTVLGKFWPRQPVYFKVNYYYHQPGSEKYKELYGESSYIPEFQFGVRFTERLTLFISRSEVSGNAILEVIESESRGSQSYFTIGVGYTFPVSRKLQLRLNGGPVIFGYMEEGLGMKLEKQVVGFRFGASVSYDLFKFIFTDFSINYNRAPLTLTPTKKTTLGGLSAGFGLGLRF